MDRSEQIRTLRDTGLSEEDAIRRSFRQGESVIDYTRRSPSKRLFVLVSKDLSGFGYAKRLTEEGEHVVLVSDDSHEDADGKKVYAQVGKGMIERMPLAQAKTKLKGPNTYWVFTENNYPKVADALRKQGQKVFGTSAFSDRMEHDRDFAIHEANKTGLKSPETKECTSREDGLQFLEEHFDRAFVLKPDEGQNAETFVPELEEDDAANEETYTYLEHLKKEPTSYILQERVRGVEVNVEVDLYEGKPFFAFATLEAKRKNPHDQGEMAGCGGDVVWVVPVDCELVKQTVGKMLPLYEQQKYTGPADANVILTKDGPCFLEACGRFGYNAHVTLFLGLGQDSLGNLLADWMDGKVEDFPSRFSKDFGASVTLFIEHPQPGIPVTREGYEQFHPFDSYVEDGRLLLAGYSPEVGIFVDQGLTPDAALDACYEKLLDESVSYPNRYFRLDLASTGYPNAILDRYHQLESMGLTGRESTMSNHSARPAAIRDRRRLDRETRQTSGDSRVRDGKRGLRLTGAGSRAGRGDSLSQAED